MKSPFPGMDPYLEIPSLWTGFHDGLIAAVRASLNRILPPQYVADIGERCYVVQSERQVYPDVVVVKPPQQHEAKQGSAVTLVADDPWEIASLSEVETIRESYIKIVAPEMDYEVITIIEVLSPANKTSRHSGREEYLKKQREVINSHVHLLEIDLLRSGEHTIAALKEHLDRHGQWDYLVCLHRGGQKTVYEVWAFTLRDRLPRVRVPLGEQEADVVLDLQEAFERCYQEGRYHRLLNYDEPPPPPLRFEDHEWLLDCLRKSGLRT